MTAIALWLATALVPVGHEESSASLKVAVINVPAASERYLRTADLEAHFEVLRRRFNERRDALRDKIERTSRALREEFKPGTDEFRVRQKQLALLEAEFQWFVESEGAKIEDDLAGSLRSIFGDIQAAVREVAEDKGIDVVLAYQDPPDAPDSPNKVRQQILLQKVLYWNPRVDLTDEVVARLNEKHKTEGTGKPGGSVPLGRSGDAQKSGNDRSPTVGSTIP